MSRGINPNSRRAKPTSGWRLWRATVREFRSGWKLYLGAALVITLPTRFLSLSSSLSSDGSFTAYVTVASIVMNLALFSIARHRLADQAVTIRAAYYNGTSNFVRYIITNAILALCFIPMVLGVVLFSAGSTPGAPLGEILLIGALGLLLSLPSLWLLVRFAFAVIISAGQEIRPVTSLRRARELTMGRFWLTTGRLIVLGIGLLLIAGILALLVVVIGLAIHNAVVLGTIFELAASLLILPLATIYLTHLYNSMSDTKA